jgi:hypothetical protein
MDCNFMALGRSRRHSGQSSVRAAAVAKTIMVLRNIGHPPLDVTASVRLKT